MNRTFTLLFGATHGYVSLRLLHGREASIERSRVPQGPGFRR